MSRKKLAVVFILERGNFDVSMLGLLKKSGASEISLRDSKIDAADFLWAGWRCTGRLDETLGYHVLIINFWQSDFLDHFHLDGESLKDDGLHDLLASLQEACFQLNPLVAFVGAHLWEAESDFIAERVSALGKGDFGSLLRDYFGALYLPKRVFGSIDPDNYRGRDVVCFESGAIVFAGTDQNRWL